MKFQLRSTSSHILAALRTSPCTQLCCRRMPGRLASFRGGRTSPQFDRRCFHGSQAVASKSPCLDRVMGLDLPSGGHLTHGYYTAKRLAAPMRCRVPCEGKAPGAQEENLRHLHLLRVPALPGAPRASALALSRQLAHLYNMCIIGPETD